MRLKNSSLPQSIGAVAGLLLAPVMPLFSQIASFKSSTDASSLVELYSSEGCSSCPPAEEWLNELKSAPGLWKDLFPIAFHVDYWDGLGWPDRFARADYTQRQRDYAARLGQDSVYTPEFIVNGAEWHRGWMTGQKVPQSKMMGQLSVTLDGREKKVSAIYSPATASAQPLVLNVALLGFDVVVDVKRGENGGRKLQHDFVVLGYATKPMEKSDGGFQCGPIEITTTTNDPPGALVAWVSSADGSIRQVAGGWLQTKN